jgi:hypothetical protein
MLEIFIFGHVMQESREEFSDLLLLLSLLLRSRKRSSTCQVFYVDWKVVWIHGPIPSAGLVKSIPVESEKAQKGLVKTPQPWTVDHYLALWLDSLGTS